MNFSENIPVGLSSEDLKHIDGGYGEEEERREMEYDDSMDAEIERALYSLYLDGYCY